MRSVILLVAGAICVAVGLVLRRTGRAAPAEEAMPAMSRTWESEPERIAFSSESLSVSRPGLSARTTLTVGQRDGLLAGLVVLVLGLVAEPHWTGLVLIGSCTVGYASSMAVRLWLYRSSLKGTELVQFSDAELGAAPDEVFKPYTVLVPVFREPEVMDELVRHLRLLDYPADRLQILLLVESDDLATLSAGRSAIGPVNDIDLVLVPPRGPRTKPKALNYGLTQATGAYVTIFDAEDRPDPLQLRKAALAFAIRPPSVACLQAQLAFFNSRQNLVTRWFEVEYSIWFRQMLPGLSKFGAPVPLGGTSNHFRREILLELGAWDPYNVTEDADLGARLSRAGFRSEILGSVTLEEANSDMVNWAKQRSRWYKGYLQTFLVHMRDLRAARKAFGTRQILLFAFLVGGTPFMAVVNPVFWMLTFLWFVVKPPWLMALYPAPLYFLGLLTWLGGNFLFTFMNTLEAIEVDDSLFLPALLTPVYWVMMSVSAYKALLQVFLAPNYWEKTRHGLTRPTLVSHAPARPSS